MDWPLGAEIGRPFSILLCLAGTPLLEAAAGILLQNLALFTPKFTANAMWGFARMEYRPPNGLLDAVLKVTDRLIDWTDRLIDWTEVAGWISEDLKRTGQHMLVHATCTHTGVGALQLPSLVPCSA
jgi:hypothetical protein